MASDVGVTNVYFGRLISILFIQNSYQELWGVYNQATLPD
jgi:hypothetical protein